MNILFEHTFRLLTLRHTGEGLAIHHKTGLALVFALSMLLFLLRWGDIGGAIFHGGFLALLTLFMPVSVAVGYALISAGVDAIALPFEQLVGESGVTFFLLWELIAAVVITYRVKAKG